MKILSVVGARPEFIQVWPLSLELGKQHQEILVHTGQHYDYEMSKVFFDELELRVPDYNLGVGSGSHAGQTAEILVRLEEVCLVENPDLVIVRGDTNSTLGGALVAAKLSIPVAHIEAGERSFNRDMPEEINRIITDQLAQLHFCASKQAVRHLENEGIRDTASWTGDVMYDAFLRMAPVAKEKSRVLDRLGLNPADYALITVHRAGNIDNPVRLNSILNILNELGEKVVFPVHPRTRQAIAKSEISLPKDVMLVDPVGYLDMLELERNAKLIATDSGGVQREAYFHRVPCLTLRDETEWRETVDSGWNQLVGVDPETVLTAWAAISPPADHPQIFGDGHAAEKISVLIERWADAG